MDFKNSETIVNLGRAFAGECQARTRYRFYASLAKKEGQFYLAKLIHEIADNEYAHAKIFFRHINNLSDQRVENMNIDAGYPYTIGETVMNLKDAASAEQDEYSEIYPKFAQIADDEGFKEVANSFRLIGKIEESHHKSFTLLAEKYADGSLYREPNSVIWRCSVCGYIHQGEKAPDICPVCQHPQGHYELQVNLKQI
ncbi:MAG: rubrerythrin family protein [Eubacteriales bacterium]|nr:rubrerythrin family protein [Eubacteriales bacterium]